MGIIGKLNWWVCKECRNSIDGSEGCAIPYEEWQEKITIDMDDLLCGYFEEK